jgi:hypothetical protein
MDSGAVDRLRFRCLGQHGDPGERDHLGGDERGDREQYAD